MPMGGMCAPPVECGIVWRCSYGADTTVASKPAHRRALGRLRRIGWRATGSAAANAGRPRPSRFRRFSTHSGPTTWSLSVMPTATSRLTRFCCLTIRAPRFAATVNDIVVEFGSARYQGVMDRFVRGEEIEHEVLRQVWQNATMPHAANDLPMYEEVFRTVRAVNASLPRERQLRVLLGEPPIDWEKVQSRADHQKWIEMRDSYPAALIRLEGPRQGAPRPPALRPAALPARERARAISRWTRGRRRRSSSLLERSGPTRVFTIWAHPRLADIQADVASRRVPSLATVRGTVLGAVDASSFVGEGIGRYRFAVRDGRIMPIPRREWRTLRTEDQLDAVLYPRAAVRDDGSAIASHGMFPTRLLGYAPQAHRPGRGTQEEADKLKELCADVRRE